MRGAIIHKPLPNAGSFLPGGAAVWRDFNFGSGSVALGASAPGLITLDTTSIRVLGFDGVNTLEQVFFGIELDHMWKEGTNINAHIHWCATTGDQGSVVWLLEYTWFQSPPHSGVVAISGSTTLPLVQAAGGAWFPRRGNWAVISGVGRTIGSQFMARLYRDPGNQGSDDYEHDAALLTIGLHVQVDTLGSRMEYIK